MDRYSTEYLDRISEHLYSSVLADILDDAGHRRQVMRPEVRPLYPGARVAGRAATMLAVEVSELPAQPYHLLMELLDSLGYASSKAEEGEREPRSRPGWEELPSSAPAYDPLPPRR